MQREEKKGKKNYNKVPNEEWIQMQDLNEPRNQELSKKLAFQSNRQYERPHKEQLFIEDVSLNKEQKGAQPKSKIPIANQQNIREDKPKKQKVTPSLPMMEVTCDFCTVIQKVPGNTQVYICGSCQGMNQCFPLYGIAACDCCQSNLGYGFGISQYIKCTKCTSILRVPLQPKKNYQSVTGIMANSHFLPSFYQQQEKPIKKNNEQFWEDRQLETPNKMPIEPSEVMVEEYDPENM